MQTSDIVGSNWTSTGKLGGGTKQFSAPSGVALDSAGKIYVSNTGKCRVLHRKNMNRLMCSKANSQLIQGNLET